MLTMTWSTTPYASAIKETWALSFLSPRSSLVIKTSIKHWTIKSHLAYNVTLKKTTMTAATNKWQQITKVHNITGVLLFSQKNKTLFYVQETMHCTWYIGYVIHCKYIIKWIIMKCILIIALLSLRQELRLFSALSFG